MAIEQVWSRTAAMRNEFCLSVEPVGYWRLPESLRRNITSYYDSSYYMELRVLYENEEAIRRQWIFRDGGGLTRISATGTGSFFGGDDTEGEKGRGFIEILNNEGAVLREFQYEDDLSEWDFRYSYGEGFLLRVETWYKEPPAPEEPEEEPEIIEENSDEDGEAKEEKPPHPPPREERKDPVFVRMYTDFYRYTRSGSLRAIDRTLHEGIEQSPPRLVFPRLGPGVSLGEDLITPGGAYTAAFLRRDLAQEGITISYHLDNRGRILTETWRDGEGAQIGQMTNTWAEDRLQSMEWKSREDLRLTEFE
jgi:hypothetical protein